MKRVLIQGMVALALAATLAGCGDEEKKESGPSANGVATMTPAEALKAWRVATQELEDVTYEGHGSLEGARMRAVMEAVVGEACQVSFMGKKGRMQIRLIGKYDYVRFDRSMAVAFGAPASVAGKWIRTPIFKGGKKCLTDPVPFTPGKASTFEVGTVRVVNGREARSFMGKSDEGDPLTLWIATTGAPLVLEVSGKDESGPYRFKLVGTDSGFDIPVPPADQTVNR